MSRIMELGPKEQPVIAVLARRLKSEFGAERVVLYGSAARGTMDAESDVDLLIVLPFVDWEIEKCIGGLAFEAGLEIDRVISTLCFSVSDLEDGPMRASPLIRNVQREGVPL